MPPGRWSDLERPPLQEAALTRALVTAGGLWRRIRIVDSTGSTNADVVAAAADGEGEGLVLVAEAQTGGRGRLDRLWTSPASSGLLFSVLLRPGAAVPAARWGWLPLLGGLAVAAAATRVAGVRATLKWPNDVMAADRKLAGILAQRCGGAVVVGVGLNVTLREDDLPVPHATSLLLAGGRSTDRDPLLRAILREIERRYTGWRAAAGDPVASGLRADYLAACSTVGRDVAVALADGTLTGRAVDIDLDGRLVIAPAAAADGEVRAIGAGDVVHLR